MESSKDMSSKVLAGVSICIVVTRMKKKGEIGAMIGERNVDVLTEQKKVDE